MKEIIMPNVINDKIDILHQQLEHLRKEQIIEAYNYLYDEYGYALNFWTDSKLIKEVEDFWKSKEK